MIEESLKFRLAWNFCLENLGKKFTDNPIKPLYFPSIEIQALITELLEVTWNLLVLESSLELVS